MSDLTSVQARMWCFTLPADEDLMQHIQWPVSSVRDPPLHWSGNKYFRYMKYQVERAPTTGLIHIQGFLCLTRGMRLCELKKHYSKRAHWEKSRGTIEDNDRYVSKEETKICGPFELGQRPEGGASKTKQRWQEVQDLAKRGYTRNQILMDMPCLAPQYRGIDAVIDSIKPPVENLREIKVFYISGSTGVGKTHHAITQFPNAFLVRGAYTPGKTFDLYQDETELILDEWSPYEWPLTLMNSILDKWKCPLSCRYANKYARWNTVVITTNVKLSECYSACLPQQTQSFKRRITYEIEMVGQVDTLNWASGNGELSPSTIKTPILVTDDEPCVPNTPTQQQGQKRSLPDGYKNCPDCMAPVIFHDGCQTCLVCGWDKTC